MVNQLDGQKWKDLPWPDRSVAMEKNFRKKWLKELVSQFLEFDFELEFLGQY